MRALLRSITGGAALGEGDREGIVVALKSLESQLEQAVGEGRRWHLWLAC